MNKSTVSSDHAIKVLSKLYPAQNWAAFFTQNRHGLTAEYPTIPFAKEGEQIIYLRRDIFAFANQFSDSPFSKRMIKRVSEFLFDHELQSLLGDLRANEENESLKRCDYLHGYKLLMKNLRDVSTAQLSTIDSLTALTSALNESKKTAATKCNFSAAAKVAAEEIKRCENNVEILGKLTKIVAHRHAANAFLNNKVRA